MSVQLRGMQPKSEHDAGLQTAIRDMAAVLRRHRLDYLQSGYVMRRARKLVGMESHRPQKRLPDNLTDAERDAFFAAIQRGGNAQHDLLFRLMYYTGLRVSELVNARREHMDVPTCSLRVVNGKGAKDRTVLFPQALQLALRLYLESVPDQAYLFESRRRQKLTTRWIQTLAMRYGEAAGITRMHPHRLRHSLLTNLSRAGLTDTQIQQVSGHSSKKALAIYQHVALADVADDYQRAMCTFHREPRSDSAP